MQTIGQKLYDMVISNGHLSFCFHGIGIIDEQMFLSQRALIEHDINMHHAKQIRINLSIIMKGVTTASLLLA